MSNETKTFDRGRRHHDQVAAALRLVGVVFKILLVGFAELLAISAESSKKVLEERQKREQRNKQKRVMMGRDPYRPSPYDE